VPVPHDPDHHDVRRSYDALAERYSAQLGDELDYKPLDRALLRALVEQLPPGAPIADLGCGPGHVAAWLAANGVHSVGIDMSPGMVAVGRREHPEVEFRQGDLLALPAADNEFGSAVAFYSVIHLEADEIAPACAEFRRVLLPGGRLLLAFHVGNEVRQVDELWGQPVDLDFRFLETAAVVDELDAAGFEVEARLERTNYPEEVETRRAYLVARRR
jgi:ubiquinone/menaquinone biosynthesis C-methylase UbiE